MVLGRCLAQRGCWEASSAQKWKLTPRRAPKAKMRPAARAREGVVLAPRQGRASPPFRNRSCAARVTALRAQESGGSRRAALGRDGASAPGEGLNARPQGRGCSRGPWKNQGTPAPRAGKEMLAPPVQQGGLAPRAPTGKAGPMRAQLLPSAPRRAVREEKGSAPRAPGRGPAPHAGTGELTLRAGAGAFVCRAHHGERLAGAQQRDVSRRKRHARGLALRSGTGALLDGRLRAQRSGGSRRLRVAEGRG